jgi:hypothetical protein
MIARFQSIAALADAIGTDNAEHYLSRHSRANDEGTPAQCLEYARHGDAALVPDAEKLIDKLAVAIDVPEREIISDIVGGWPSVPDFIAGHPDCMRRRAAVESEASPLAIWVIVTASYSVNPEQMTRRGTAILALVMALSRIRPIELGIISLDMAKNGTESVIAATVNTTPLDIATAAYALTSAAFFRRLCYGLASKLHNIIGRWPQAYLSDRKTYLAGLLERLGADPTRDLIIEGAFISDPLLDDPIAWVRGQVAKFGSAA